jgi:hypothetical protein
MVLEKAPRSRDLMVGVIRTELTPSAKCPDDAARQTSM